MKITWFANICAVFALMLTAATAESGADLDHRQFLEVPYGTVDAAAVWPSLKIEVCFQEDYSGQLDNVKLVREAVKTNIEGNSNFRFLGWDQCSGSLFPRIEVVFSGKWPVSNVGRQWERGSNEKIRDLPTIINLNFINFCPRGENERRCLEVVAVHEFLHALGFLHEHLRPEALKENPNCTDKWKREIAIDVHGSQPIPVTSYDAASIMNYCVYPDRYKFPASLSDQDKQTLKYLEDQTRDKIAKVAQ